MDKGDGSVDVYTDMWMPNQQAIWDKYIVEAKTVGHNEPYLGTQGMYVPHYLAGQVKSFEDLARPEVAARFDKDGNGKGEYWAGDAGWKSTKMWQVKFKSYGLTELWEPEIVSDATFKAQLKAAYTAEQPIIFYYWTPEWIHAAYDILPLGEPARTEGCMDLKLDQEDWLEASTFACKHSDAMVYVAHSKSLEQRNPAAAKFLAQIKLDPAVVNGWSPPDRPRQGGPAGRRRGLGRGEHGHGERLDQVGGAAAPSPPAAGAGLRRCPLGRRPWKRPSLETAPRWERRVLRTRASRPPSSFPRSLCPRKRVAGIQVSWERGGEGSPDRTPGHGLLGTLVSRPHWAAVEPPWFVCGRDTSVPRRPCALKEAVRAPRSPGGVGVAHE